MSWLSFFLGFGAAMTLSFAISLWLLFKVGRALVVMTTVMSTKLPEPHDADWDASVAKFDQSIRDAGRSFQRPFKP